MLSSLVVVIVCVCLLNRSVEPVPRAALSRSALERAKTTDVVARAAHTRGVEHAMSASELRPAPRVEIRSEFDPPRWHPRPSEEWQGMLVNTNVKPPCDSSEGCGSALACKQGVCVACQLDADCGRAELCVLDHCLRKELAECHRAADCPRGNVCYLTGLSATLRGNDAMAAKCVNPMSGSTRQPPGPADAPPRDMRTSLPDDKLLQASDRVRQH